jgi:hypothetical protein
LVVATPIRLSINFSLRNTVGFEQRSWRAMRLALGPFPTECHLSGPGSRLTGPTDSPDSAWPSARRRDWTERSAETPAFAQRVQRGHEFESSHARDRWKQIIRHEFGNAMDERLGRAHALHSLQELKFGIH